MASLSTYGIFLNWIYVVSHTEITSINLHVDTIVLVIELIVCGFK